jgi:hypothetical protein
MKGAADCDIQQGEGILFNLFGSTLNFFIPGDLAPCFMLQRYPVSSRIGTVTPRGDFLPLNPVSIGNDYFQQLCIFCKADRDDRLP